MEKNRFRLGIFPLFAWIDNGISWEKICLLCFHNVLSSQLNILNLKLTFNPRKVYLAFGEAFSISQELSRITFFHPRIGGLWYHAMDFSSPLLFPMLLTAKCNNCSKIQAGQSSFIRCTILIFLTVLLILDTLYTSP